MTEEENEVQAIRGMGAGDHTPDQPNDLESLQEALSQEKERSEKYLANWQRAQADFINFKKRTEQDRADGTKFANAVLLTSLLPVLDDLERALANVSAKLARLPWVDGIGLIYRKLQSTLESQGLTRIETEGKDFDPNVHEAVLYAEGEEGKILQELQKGYKLHERLMRPALVKVGRKAEAPVEHAEEENLAD